MTIYPWVIHVFQKKKLLNFQVVNHLAADHVLLHKHVGATERRQGCLNKHGIIIGPNPFANQQKYHCVK